MISVDGAGGVFGTTLLARQIIWDVTDDVDEVGAERPFNWCGAGGAGGGDVHSLAVFADVQCIARGVVKAGVDKGEPRRSKVGDKIG